MFLNPLACAMIIIWAVWCILSTKVQDGIIGKIIYSAIALSALAIALSNADDQGIHVASTSLNFWFAIYAAREIWMHYAWGWLTRCILHHECQLFPRDKKH